MISWSEADQTRVSVLVIGAGPAGLTASYLLAKSGVSVAAIEADPQYVGGISRTVRRDGFHFDIGGHRFFSKSREVEDFWTEILPDDMLDRPRSSRIYYRGKFFQYPLKPVEALRKLGIIESMLCVLSYLKARVFPRRDPVSFEDWVTNQFGARLFRIFFKTYTEKVWGMSCREISADWAAQRIKGLSLFSAVKNAIFKAGGRSRDKVIKTLIDTFRYPRRGPGMMWEACAEKVRRLGGSIVMGCRADALEWDEKAAEWRVSVRERGPAGAPRVFRAKHVVSSAPIRELIPALSPAVSEETWRSAASLGYRDFITVTLAIRGEELFSDNWVYIHDPAVKVGRIQNFRSWSPEMVPESDEGASRGPLGCYGLEYFCFEGDGLWTRPDEELVELAWSELRKIGLAERAELVRGYVVRQAKAYPVYDENYLGHVERIRAELERKFPTLHLVGRNGMHKYNNQDHAIMTAMLTVRNIQAGERIFDVWKVNQDAEYHEDGQRPESQGASGLREVPTRVVEKDAA